MLAVLVQDPSAGGVGQLIGKASDHSLKNRPLPAELGTLMVQLAPEVIASVPVAVV